MTTINLQFDRAQIDAVHALLGDIRNGAERAISKSLNRTLDGAVTLTAQRISGKVTLKSGYVKDHIKKTKARNYQLGAAMRMQSGKVPLAAFSTNPAPANFQARDRGNGVSVKVWKDKPPVRFKHAFFAIMPNGYIGLFERNLSKSRVATGLDSKDRPRKYRLPIDELKGPYLSSIYTQTPGLAHEVETTSAERLLRELQHEVDYLLGINNG